VSHSPAFFWSGRPGMGLAGGDYLHEASGADLQRAVSAMGRAAAQEPLLSKPAQSPEVQLVFLYDELGTEDVRTLGKSAFPKLHKRIAESPSSLSVPFTTRSKVPLRFEGATNVPVAKAEEHLANFPKLATNGKTDILLVQLPVRSEMDMVEKREHFAAQDDMVERVTEAVSKATGGNYAALLTGKAGASSEIAHLTTRRRLSDGELETGLPITPELMAALMVGFLLIIIFLNGFCCLFQLQTPKKFDEVKAQ